MLEDHNMDKKNRLNQPLNKGNGSESKKNQDVTSNKQIPRSSRRREPAGSVPKNDNRGKPSQQKFKTFDKRPKPRGGVVCGKEGSQINMYEDEPELGSIYTPGSKKQNLNHLLNFQYGSPHQYGGAGQGGRNYATSRQRDNNYNQFTLQYAMSNHKHKYNKEQFLQANCQFVVRNNEDYTVHMGDPDQLVRWELIEQIRGFGNEDIKCPICLDIPKASQITRCGHCFCWPCILHYLALSDKSWRKCPICYESVHLKDLKSYSSVIKIPCNVNEDIIFQLMKRERGSTLLSPVSQFEQHTPATLLQVSEMKLDTVYSKLLTATDADILNIINTEQKELELLLEDLTSEQCPTLCFTERALDLLKKRKEEMMARIEEHDHETVKTNLTQEVTQPIISMFDTNKQNQNISHTMNQNIIPSVVGTYPASINEKVEIEFGAVGTHVVPDSTEAGAGVLQYDSSHLGISKSDNIPIPVTDSGSSVASSSLDDVTPISDVNRRRYESMSSEDGGHSTQPTTITADDLYIAHESNLPQKYFYFYQAIDGQQIFLHAVNVRMLEMTYGSLENCPYIIKGRILEKEAGSMTEELRKRLRYLQHLPVTCQFEVAEIELKPPMISDDTVERFRDQLSSRERRRMKRAREERRRSKRIEEVESKQFGHPSSRSHSRRIHIDSHYQFPEFGVTPPFETSYIPVIRSADSSRASSPGGSVSRRSESPSVSALQALSLDDNTSTKTSYNTSFAQKLREGKDIASDSMLWPSVGERRRTTSGDESDSMVPHYRQSFGQALATTIENNIYFHTETDHVNQPRGAGASSNNSSSSNKKKKRKQQTLLFTTGGVPKC